MDKLDKKIKKVLIKQKASEQYNKMITNTMDVILKDEKVVDIIQKKKSKFLKLIQSAAATVVIGILGITTYATVNRWFKY